MVKEYKGFKYLGRMDFSDSIYKGTKFEGKTINLYNCLKCNSTLTNITIEENNGKCPSCNLEKKL